MHSIADEEHRKLGKPVAEMQFEHLLVKDACSKLAPVAFATVEEEVGCRITAVISGEVVG